MTNYEKVKSKSIEEMAEFISSISKTLGLKLDGEYVLNMNEGVLDWLRKEVSE